MKNKYKKPLLAVERFALAQSIARDCGNTSIPASQITSGDIHSCLWDLGGGMTVFIGGAHCVLDGEKMGYACYNNPAEGNFVFKS